MDPESALSESEVENLGSSSVCRIQGKGCSMREGKVLTWPQLFILGAHADLTAMQIFTAGCHMELMLMHRERSVPNADVEDAARLRFKDTGMWGQGW